MSEKLFYKIFSGYVFIVIIVFFGNLYFTRQCSDTVKVWWHIQQHICYKFSAECAGEKKNGKSVNIWRRYGQKFSAYFFVPPCTCRRRVAMLLQEGCTALHVACSCRSVDVALLLLNAQAAVDLLDNVINITITICK